MKELKISYLSNSLQFATCDLLIATASAGFGTFLLSAFGAAQTNSLDHGVLIAKHLIPYAEGISLAVATGLGISYRKCDQNVPTKRQIFRMAATCVLASIVIGGINMNDGDKVKNPVDIHSDNIFPSDVIEKRMTTSFSICA
jgi:hypothetical protein